MIASPRWSLKNSKRSRRFSHCLLVFLADRDSVNALSKRSGLGSRPLSSSPLRRFSWVGCSTGAAKMHWTWNRSNCHERYRNCLIILTLSNPVLLAVPLFTQPAKRCWSRQHGHTVDNVAQVWSTTIFIFHVACTPASTTGTELSVYKRYTLFLPLSLFSFEGGLVGYYGSKDALQIFFLEEVQSKSSLDAGFRGRNLESKPKSTKNPQNSDWYPTLKTVQY